MQTEYPTKKKPLSQPNNILKPIITASERLYRIVEEGMCVGCGLCESIAGKDVIEMKTSQLNYQRPHVVGALTQETVDQIYDVCPGLRQDSMPEQFLDDETTVDLIWGPHKYIASAHATDQNVRSKAATGGVLTALSQFLIDTKRVSFVLHVKPSNEDVTFGEEHISLTADDVQAGSGSIYGPTAPLRNIGAILDRGQPFAFVGKPCDISALRNFATYDPRVNELIRYWLTPTCGGSVPPPQMDIFLKSKGTRRENLVWFKYRGDGCPGDTEFETKDGVFSRSSAWEPYGYDPELAAEESWQIPFRCKICPDGSGEGADIMAGDQWVNCAPDPEFSKIDKGTNMMIVRTSVGEKLVSAAVEAGYLTIECVREAHWFYDMQPHLIQKKMYAKARWDGLAAIGRLSPRSYGLRLDELARRNTNEVNAAQMAGTQKRLSSGKEDEPTPEP